MSNKLQPLKGMKDILPSKHREYSNLVNTARKIGAIYGYEELTTPILELVSVFDRSLGESSDVISKEMYDFRDKGDRHVAMRPELTASVMRAVITNDLASTLPLKLLSIGPVFRYDRPQAGRQRQFNQINYEFLGASDPYTDAETIELAFKLLEELQVLPKVRLEINSLGCHKSRKKYSQALFEYFMKNKTGLSEDSQLRIQSNPLRILDSKLDQDKKIVAGAPVIDEFYSEDSANYFASVLSYLDILGVEYNINKKLARGLDYYCHTTFEFITDELGAQGTVLAGGRYDGLCKMLGGPDISGIGFAAGIERLMMTADQEIDMPRSVYIMPMSSNEISESARLASLLRSAGVSTNVDSNGKIQKRLSKAVKRNARYVVFIGESEVQHDIYKVKNLDDGTENSMSLITMIKLFKQEFAGYNK